MRLSEELQKWRIDRPDEWKMDEFIRKARELEQAQLAGGEAVAVAEAVRQMLADKYQRGIDTDSADMGGNCDWARLEGAVKVVQALKLLQPAPAIKQQVAEDADEPKRPDRLVAENAIYGFLCRRGIHTDFHMAEDGDDGWSFWILHEDTTSYVHADLSIEWYGTSYGEEEPTHPVSANQPDSGKVPEPAREVIDALHEVTISLDSVVKQIVDDGCLPTPRLWDRLNKAKAVCAKNPRFEGNFDYPASDFKFQAPSPQSAIVVKVTHDLARKALHTARDLIMRKLDSDWQTPEVVEAIDAALAASPSAPIAEGDE